MPRLPRSFFARYTPSVARDLLGCILVRRVEGNVLTGKIVEVEAYRGKDDPASHAYRGVTERTRVMFGEAGHAYVYFTYGNHYCLNATTEAEGEPGAVLIRAAEPLRGIREMRKRRGVHEVTDLMSGPGKLTQAFAIDKGLNGEDLVVSRRLYLLEGKPVGSILVSTRIGVSTGRETEWRYYLDGSPFVSGGRTHNYRKRGRGNDGVVG